MFCLAIAYLYAILHNEDPFFAFETMPLFNKNSATLLIPQGEYSTLNAISNPKKGMKYTAFVSGIRLHWSYSMAWYIANNT